MVRRLAARILGALIASAILRIAGGKRTDAARHQQTFTGIKDRGHVGIVGGQRAQRDEQQLVRAHREIRTRLRRRLAVPGIQAIGKTICSREETHDTFRRLVREGLPASAHKTKRGNPQRLNIDRVATARRAGGIVRIHPCEVRGRPHETRRLVHADSVGRPLRVVLDDRSHRLLEETQGVGGLTPPAGLLRPLLHAQREPQLRIHGVAVPRRLAVDDVGQCAMFLKRRKRRQDLLGVIYPPRRNRTAQKDEGVASPVEEPRIARNHRLVVAATDEEQIQSRREPLR